MSLISEALRKAQQTQSPGSSLTSGSVPGSPAPAFAAPATVRSPQSFWLQLIAVLLFLLVLVGGGIALLLLGVRSEEKIEALALESEGLEESPVPTKPMQSTSPAHLPEALVPTPNGSSEAGLDSGHSFQAVPAVVSATPSGGSGLEVPPSPESGSSGEKATAGLTGLVDGVPDHLSADSGESASSAPPVPPSAPAVPPAPPGPDPAVVDYLNKVRIRGVMVGRPGRVILFDPLEERTRTFEEGAIVHIELQLTVATIEPDAIIFTDHAGVTYRKYF